MREYLGGRDIGHNSIIFKRLFLSFLSVQDRRLVVWRLLIYISILYNFHRYIFKYSHGGYPKEGYQQTPLIWQMGKFVIIGLLLLLIYYKSRFSRRVKKSVIIFYFFVFIIFATNILSGILYSSISTDEIEYCLYAFMFLPMGALCKVDLKRLAVEFSKSLHGCQIILILSNWVVIYNYFVNNILPFHAYEGILLRFGGFWDDPNTLSIFSVFLFGYSVINKHNIYAALNAINVILAISFGGYIILIVISAYLMLKSSLNRTKKILIIVSVLLAGLLFTSYNADVIIAVYEAKQQSVLEHTTVDLLFSPLPLANPIQFHETWFISLNANYFPFSVIIDFFIIYMLLRALNSRTINLQNILIIIFFTANMFLPFLYMFPINFVSLFLLILFLRGVYI